MTCLNIRKHFRIPLLTTPRLHSAITYDDDDNHDDDDVDADDDADDEVHAGLVLLLAGLAYDDAAAKGSTDDALT